MRVRRDVKLVGPVRLQPDGDVVLLVDASGTRFAGFCDAKGDPALNHARAQLAKDLLNGALLVLAKAGAAGQRPAPAAGKAQDRTGDLTAADQAELDAAEEADE